MRARNVKPGFFQNEYLAELPPETRLLFMGLWLMADREGRLEDRPKRIKMQLFPADTWDVDPMLDALAEKNLIVRYEIDSVRYIAIPAWHKHQRPHVKEKASTIPPPSPEGAGTGNSGAGPPDSLIPDSLNTPSPREGARARRIPDDFELTPERRAVAEAEKVPADRTFASFVDYWRAASGQKARKHDWDATWRNWCRRQADMAPTVKTNTPVKSDGFGAFDD